MKKIYLKQQVKELNAYPLEVINSITKIIFVLNENYGVRDVEKDLDQLIIVK